MWEERRGVLTSMVDGQVTELFIEGEKEIRRS